MTLRYALDHHDVVAKFVTALIPYCRGFGTRRAIGVVNEQDELIAGAVFHNFFPRRASSR